MIGGAEKESELKGSIALGGARELGGREGRRGGRKAEIQGDFGLSRRMEKKDLYEEQMAERPDGSQGRSREEDSHSRRTEEKTKGDRERNRETDKPNELEISSAQVVVQTKSIRLLNQLNKELSHYILIFSFTINKFKSSSFKLNRGG